MRKMKVGDDVRYAGGESTIHAIHTKKKMVRVKSFAIDFHQEDFAWNNSKERWEHMGSNQFERDKKAGWKFCECATSCYN